MQERARAVPPYVPYRTFRTFLEFLLEGIPDRIDRSVWGSRFSGSSGSQLMTALKAFSLIDATGRPQKELERLVFAEGEERRAFYATCCALLRSGVRTRSDTRDPRPVPRGVQKIRRPRRCFGEVRGVLYPGGDGRRNRVSSTLRPVGTALVAQPPREQRGPPGRASERRPRARTRVDGSPPGARIGTTNT